MGARRSGGSGGGAGEGNNKGVAPAGGVPEESDTAPGDGQRCHGCYFWFQGDNWDRRDQVGNAQLDKRQDNAGRGGVYDDGGA